jgi:hypothetical protein
MNPWTTPESRNTPATRREFLSRAGLGLGAVSLSSLFEQTAQAAGGGNLLAARKPHFPAKAKAVIHIFASGGPSHVDTWDPKPELLKQDGKELPELKGLAYGSPFKFEKKGKSGLEISEVFPKLGNHADDLCVVRSMWTDVPAHDIAQRFFHTGNTRLPRPSLGSWTLYGLGSENENLPGFITMGGEAEWRQSSFLPGVFQGCAVNFSQNANLGEIILNLKNQFTTPSLQRRQLNLAQRMNELHSLKLQKDDQLEARIAAYEMAFKMQTEATDAFDIMKEKSEMREQYGNTPLGAKLLVARRLVERGVRFVQITHGGWDTHNKNEEAVAKRAGEIDQPFAALLKDLRERGMLDSTLVLWGGEFGRTVTRDRNGNEFPGRDHNARAFSFVMAGGGVKGGMSYGATDDFGSRAVLDRVHVHDIHSTIMHLLGFDHTKLTFRYNGRDFRLTDNYGKVVKAVIA